MQQQRQRKRRRSGGCRLQCIITTTTGVSVSAMPSNDIARHPLHAYIGIVYSVYRNAPTFVYYAFDEVVGLLPLCRLIKFVFALNIMCSQTYILLIDSIPNPNLLHPYQWPNDYFDEYPSDCMFNSNNSLSLSRPIAIYSNFFFLVIYFNCAKIELMPPQHCVAEDARKINIVVFLHDLN